MFVKYSRYVNIVLLSLSLLVTLFITDALIQWRYPIPGKDYLDVIAKPPGSILTFVSAPDNFETTHRYSRFGSRGSDFSIEPTTDIRIIAIGDSFTEGVGAQEEKTWPAILSQRLSDLDVKVLNFGKSGIGPNGYARILTRSALRLKPTDVIICFIPNDFPKGFKLPKNLQVRTKFSNIFLEQRSIWTKSVAFLFPGWIYLIEHTFLQRWEAPQRGTYWSKYNESSTEWAVAEITEQYEHLSERDAEQIVQKRMNEMDPQVIQAAEEGKFNPTMVSMGLGSPGRHYAISRIQRLGIYSPDRLKRNTQEWLSWYKQTCQQLGTRPWVVYFPSAQLVSNTLHGVYPDNHPIYLKRFDVFGDTSLRDLLKEICMQLHIPFIDVTNILMKHNDEKLFLRYDTHPTARAYQLAGETVAEQMRAVLMNSN